MSSGLKGILCSGWRRNDKGTALRELVLIAHLPFLHLSPTDADVGGRLVDKARKSNHSSKSFVSKIVEFCIKGKSAARVAEMVNEAAPQADEAETSPASTDSPDPAAAIPLGPMAATPGGCCTEAAVRTGKGGHNARKRPAE